MSTDSSSSLVRTSPTHKCGRCRLDFTLAEESLQTDVHWWLCPPCRERLLGDKSSVDSRWP
jgi:hypothetical protein